MTLGPWIARARGYLLPFWPVALAAALALAAAWWLFYTWREPTFILTPFQGAVPLAPLYAWFQERGSERTLVPILILAAALAAWRFLPARREVLFLLSAVAFSIAFRFSVHAIRSDYLPGREFLFYPNEDVINDVGRVTSVGDFLRSYTDLQPRLSLHGQHQPPGFALIDYGLTLLLGRDAGLIGSALTFLASLVVLPAYFLGRGLRGRVEDGRACAMLAGALPGSVAFGAVSMDAVFATLAATIYAVAVHEMRRPRLAPRCALGLLLAIGMMLTYSTFVVGLFCALVILLERFRRPLACLAHLLEVLAAFALPLVALRLFTGFDALLCFSNAWRINRATLAEIVGHSLGGAEVWRYASAGNLLAFLISLGPAVVAGWLLLIGHRFAREEAIVEAAFALILAVSVFGGFYLMESERIFLYLAPAAVLVAVLPATFRPRTAVALAGLQAIVMEVFLDTLW